MMDRFLASKMESLLSIPGSRLYRKFVADAHSTRATQTRVLAEILERASDTEIGRNLDFAGIEGYEQYQSKVPIHDYEDLRPYVDRHASGEKSVLFPGKPLMYNHSSGTTAKAKLLPVSPYAFERTLEDRGKLWLYNLSRQFPGIFSGKALSLTSPAQEGQTEDGTPFGSLSGVIYQSIPNFMKNVHSIPYDAVLIKNYDAKVYALMRFAVPCKISSIFTGNPATVQNLVSRAESWRESLIHDIRHGTLSSDFAIEPEIRARLEALLEPAPERADELEAIFAKTGEFKPRDYWPDLRLVHCWTNGNCRLVIPKLREYFRADTPILDFGYIASEITATDVILANGDSVLQVQNAFFEFKRWDDEDMSSKDGGEFLLADQLEAGQRYFIYVTTFSGLYRYDMNDIIEVTGKFGDAPTVKFMFKGKGVTSIQGEKLSEEQFIEAVDRAAEQTGLSRDFFVGYANAEASRYDLYVELPSGTSNERADEFGHVVDEILHEVNVEYEAKRKSDRLAPLRVIQLGDDAFARYRTMRLAEGAHAGQLKWLHLSSTQVTRQRMQHLAESADTVGPRSPASQVEAHEQRV